MAQKVSRSFNKYTNEKVAQPSLWQRATTRNSEWSDKDEFLDVIYWIRQVLGVVLGIVWGLLPLKGFIAIVIFLAINAAILYLYFTNFQGIDHDDYGGAWELTKEGFALSVAGFLTAWIIVYSGIHNS